MTVLIALLFSLLSSPACASNWLTKVAKEGKVKDMIWEKSSHPYEEFSVLIDSVDDQGHTPLISAILGRNTDMVRTLLYDADPTKMGTGGRPPLVGAAAMRQLKVLKMLLDDKRVKGSDTDNDGCTGIWGLADADHSEDPAPIIRLLIERGADPSKPCASANQAPLHRAAERGDFPTTKALVLAGAALDPIDKEERTPLYLAAEKGHSKVVDFLLDRGADPTLRRANVSPAMAAEAAGFTSVASALRKGESAFVPHTPGAKATRAIASDADEPTRKPRPENPKDFALIVGVEKYANGLPDAQYAERDAAAIRAHLVSLGVPERNIRFLTGSRASLSAMMALVEDWLMASVTEQGRAFFYFSGHGSPDATSGQVYLVPHDGIPSLLSKTAYPVKQLYASLDRLKARQIVVMLDACFSGMGGRSVLPEGARPLVAKTSVALNPGSRILLLAAAGPSQITGSLPDQGHGIFTYHLLKGLGGAAAEKDGSITPLGLYEYLKPKVQNAAARQDREQTPVLEGAVSGELFAAPNP